MAPEIVIVGAGLFGSVLAERISSEYGLPVRIIDRRRHIGGNCWSETDAESGVEAHLYGPHIFHTTEKHVWDYVSRFTEWNGYQHHAWTRSNGRIFSLPINLSTINAFYNRIFSPPEAEAFIAAEAAKESIIEPANLEEKAVSMIGRPLYEAFIKGYTIKQWEKDPRELPASIITRLPVRFNYNSRYFNDRYEGIPLDGYGALFRKMLNNPLIDISLNTSWESIRNDLSKDARIIFTGPIDRFFDCRLGALEWRTLDFDVKRFPVSDYQGAGIINFADADIKYTRSTEFAHFHPERPSTGKTILFYESSRKANQNSEPYYPINTSRNIELLEAYQAEASKLPNVIFGGRLGSYKYYDMDDTIANALALFSGANFKKWLLVQ